jgi:cytochrome c oxidase cbb3-type subunit 4
MNVDINTLRGLLTLALLILFVCLFLWAYNRKRAPAFNEAANLPFADEDLSQRSGEFSAARGESK